MMRSPIAVRAAAEADRAVAATIFAQAFVDDPAMAHLFRDAAGRPARLQRFFGMMTAADADSDAGNWSLALGATGVPVAAAMWRPPGAPESQLGAMLWALPQLVGVFGTGLWRAFRLQRQLEKHHSAAPHWYLQFAGCLPHAQGKGYGGAAIRARLADCDAQRLPAALETATPSNLGLYQALGFEITDRFDGAAGLPFWAMWREPKALQ